jgi:hypothetical protein
MTKSKPKSYCMVVNCHHSLIFLRVLIILSIMQVHCRYWVFVPKWFVVVYSYVSLKECNLFVCLSVRLRSPKLQCLLVLLVLLESTWWIGVNWVGFIMFQPIVKLLNIEQFFQWKKKRGGGLRRNLKPQPSTKRLRWDRKKYLLWKKAVIYN